MSGTATEGVLLMEELRRQSHIRRIRELEGPRTRTDTLGLPIQETPKVSPAGEVDKKLIKISGFFELESMKNVEVLIFDCSTSSREKLPIQIMFEDDIISTYFPGREVPDRFVSKNVGSMISFTVTLSPYGYSRGLDLCLVYSLPADIDVLRRRPLEVEIRIPSRGIERFYRPRCHGIPGTGEDMVWLIHWIVGDLFKEGDVVLVKFKIDIALSGKIKECGVSLMPCSKVDTLQCWETLGELLKSDAFQVMISQDGYKEEKQRIRAELVKVYTPYKTSKTLTSDTSDTLGFDIHRETPKVSHGKVSRRLINIIGFMERDRMENMDVLIVDSITSSRKKLPIQILYEHGIISTYFTGREVPDRFVSKNVGSMISFTVTLSPIGYYRGLDLCLVYTLPDDVFFSQIPLHVEIYIRSRGIKRFYTPRYYGIPGTGGDMVWQMHWVEEDLFKEGDEVLVMFYIHPEGQIKECGVRLLLCSKNNAATYWGSLRAILNSNEFQVLPTPDSHELVKDYTPDETLYTRKSYTNSLRLPIWKTPKVSPVGKVDKKLIKISGFFELESMKNVEVLIVDVIMSTRKKLPIQIIFEHDIISTYFPGREVPDRFASKNVGSMISFTVTLSHYGYCRGLDLCLVYSLPADRAVLGRIPPLQVEISIPRRGIRMYYRPRCYGIPGTGEDMVWLIHWVEGDLFKEGDVVLVKFETDGKIKDCGVSLLSCRKFEALQYWRTLKKLLESNAFQVLPLPGFPTLDEHNLPKQVHQYSDPTICISDQEGMSGTATEGVLSMEELRRQSHIRRIRELEGPRTRTDTLGLPIQETPKVSPAGEVDKKLIKISGFFELESMKNVEVLIFDCSTSSREKLPIQIMFEDDIISTYFPGREVPDRFVSKNVGSMISFTVTLSPYGYSRGLDLCLVYSLPADIDVLRRRPLEVEIRIPSRGIERFYRPRCHGIPGTGEDMVWLIHWIVGDLFKEGDVVLVKFKIDIALSGKIKECGVSLMPCSKVDTLQCWETLRELLKSDAFQVMISQDRYKEENQRIRAEIKKDERELVKVYTPYNTSNTLTSDMLGFHSHRDTPKVSHGKVSRQLINISGFMEWDRMENMDVLIVDSVTSSRKKLPVQILYEHGIISTYSTGREVPDRFVSKNVGSMISFTVTLSPSGYYRGLDLCLVYTLPDDVFFSQIPLHVEIYIRSRGIKRFYTPRYYGIPGTGGDMVWQMHWVEEDLFKEGDEVLVMFYIHPEGQIKECGVRLLLCSKNNAATYWGSLRAILNSNEFQVLPTPDSQVSVKANTPKETLYTRKSYTDSLSLPIWETPKVSPVGKVDEQLINISGFFELDSMKNVEVLIVDCIMSTRKKLPIQIIFEHDIISTYFPGREVPDRFVSKNVGSVIYFTVTLSHYGYCRGLDLCLLYSLPAYTVTTEFRGKIVPPLRVEIRIVNRGIKRYYRPRCFGIPGTGEDMVWLIHWVEGDLFKEGDLVLVKFETDVNIKGCGVSLLSCPKFEALQYWETLKKSLESNAFQVLPLPGLETPNKENLPESNLKSREEEDPEHLQLQMHQYSDGMISISKCGSSSGTAPEGGVLSMEESREVVTQGQKLSPEDQESLMRVTDELSHPCEKEVVENLLEAEESMETTSNPQALKESNCHPMEGPPAISHYFSILRVLDLSYTEINSLPQSISRLVALQKLFLRNCELLMELPPEIGELTNLEVLDLEGTEILCLPKEIAKLVNLKCLKVSFYGYANQTAIPRRVLLNLSRLNELIIDVTPYGEWWDAEVEDITDDLFNLDELRTLKLYLPTAELLEGLTRIFSGLANFRFTVGRHEEQFISRLPQNVEEEFNNWEKLEKGLKFINGNHIPNEITKVLKHANAFVLKRHWTAESLSEFGHENMNEVKFCLVMECNELQTIVDCEQFYQGKDGRGESEDFKDFDEAIVLGSLEKLIIRYMKNMVSIWKGLVGKGSLSNLKSLALHTCPSLTALFTIDMLRNLMNLEELIVEDCPKIESLVSLKSTGSNSGLFLRNLKKISLLELPELVSISSGLWIAPNLERMVIFYCPKLEKLSTTEVSSTELKVIKGEKEWWDALKWYESDLSAEHEDYLARLFIPLRRDGDLMAQLTED